MDASVNGSGGEPTPLAPAPERAVADDLARKALMVAPVVILLAGLVRGLDGAVSAAIALGLVAANFLASSAIIAWFARMGTGALAGAAMFGYVARLGVLLVAIIVLGRVSWIDVPTLVVVLFAAHLGLLFWEARSVSLTAAFAGLRPEKE